MGHFNVLKGAYPTLRQIDKTLPVAAGESGIVRGSVIYTDGATFKLGTASQVSVVGAYPYIALMAQTDLTAGMAGSVGQGGPSGGTPVITGVALGMPMEFETDQFDSAGSYSIGDLLTFGAAGRLAAHSSGENCLGQVTKTVFSRWVNDAVALTGFRTGANVNVLTARSLYVPLLVA